jgi:hypothetical protein
MSVHFYVEFKKRMFDFIPININGISSASVMVLAYFWSKFALLSRQIHIISRSCVSYIDIKITMLCFNEVN